jgi:hypothetical protein
MITSAPLSAMPRFCPWTGSPWTLVRDHVDPVLGARAVADLDDLAAAELVGGELEIAQVPVVGAGRGPQDRALVRRTEARQQRRVGRLDADALLRQQRVRSRAPHGNPAVADLGGQHEVADELGPFGQQQGVPGLGRVQGLLQIRPRADVDG